MRRKHLWMLPLPCFQRILSPLHSDFPSRTVYNRFPISTSLHQFLFSIVLTSPHLLIASHLVLQIIAKSLLRISRTLPWTVPEHLLTDWKIEYPTYLYFALRKDKICQFRWKFISRHIGMIDYFRIWWAVVRGGSQELRAWVCGTE